MKLKRKKDPITKVIIVQGPKLKEGPDLGAL
jgi:hypothetical protein